ncbi:MAG TPA: DUF3800 domain-containing protein [Pseudomonadales bacterium]|nr:DUF3800 domain-containing protein [Pseudomonadales bacterium]
MMLTAYADESYTREEGNFKHVTVGGFIAQASYWKTFCIEWAAALKKYRVKYFHFKEFNSKKFCNESRSDYLGWSDERREDFLYELAAIAGSVAVPFGGTVPASQFIKDGVTDDPVLVAYTAFFSDLRESIQSHWPKLTGQNFRNRVHFILDENEDKKWTIPFQQAYAVYKQREPIFGHFTAGNDKEDLPLQAADLFVNATRQQGERFAQQPRILDLLLCKNLYAGTDEHTFSKLIKLGMKCDWNESIKRMRKQQIEFRKSNPGKIFFPLEHPPFRRII